MRKLLKEASDKKMKISLYSGRILILPKRDIFFSFIFQGDGFENGSPFFLRFLSTTHLKSKSHGVNLTVVYRKLVLILFIIFNGLLETTVLVIGDCYLLHALLRKS